LIAQGLDATAGGLFEIISFRATRENRREQNIQRHSEQPMTIVRAIN
jgi:hypothetical protein